MLGELLTSVATALPEKAALMVGSRHASYRELEVRAHALAHNLLRAGLSPGDRVVIQLPNGIEAALSHFACYKAGLIAVPCNTQLKRDEMSFVVDHTGARAYVGRVDWYERFAAPNVQSAALACIALVGDGERRKDALSFDALSTASDASSWPPLATIDPNLDSLILHTSGTTSRPKGVLHTQNSLWECTRLLAEAAGLRADERVLLMCPMMHISGLLQLLSTVFVRGTAAIVPPLDPAAALDTIEQVGCTHLFGLPVAYHLLVREQQRAPRRVETIRSALGGGDSLPPALIHAFRSAFGVPIQEGHGMSECAPNLVNPPTGLRPGSMGRPLPGVEARVDAAPGEAGELRLRTPALFSGYWRDDGETRKAFQGGFFRTGDLARVDADGFFWFAGRRKEIIVHGGANVAPQDVEEALCQHPAVMQAGVVGVPDPLWGESVQAFVVLEPGTSATADELRSFLADRLADWKMPAAITVERELPLGPTGKVQRRLLRERVLAAAGER